MRSCLAAILDICYNEVVGFADWRRPGIFTDFSVEGPTNPTPFSTSRNTAGEISKKTIKGFGFCRDAARVCPRRCQGGALVILLKLGSNLVVKLHQIRTKLQIRARKRLFCLGNYDFAEQNPPVFLGGELQFRRAQARFFAAAGGFW